jgi:hypothetical protein
MGASVCSSRRAPAQPPAKRRPTLVEGGGRRGSVILAAKEVEIGMGPEATPVASGPDFACVTCERNSVSLACANFGFGRAVSRILSAPNMSEERIICLSSQYPEPFPHLRKLERATPRSPIWPCTRWGFPCLVAYAPSGGLLPHLFTLIPRTGRYIFCGTIRRDASRRRRPRVSRCPAIKNRCSRLRGTAPYGVRTFLPSDYSEKRFSALPKP